MRNINFTVGDNLGGLDVFWYADAADVAVYPPVLDGVAQGDVVMKPGKVFYVFRATMGTLQYREPARENRNGTLYTPELKGFLPKDTPNLAAAFGELSGRRLVALYRDNNGQMKLVGSRDHWLTFERELDTAAGPSGRNGAGFTLRGGCPYPAPFYQGVFPTDAGAPVPPPPTTPPGAGGGNPPAAQPVTVLRGDGSLVATVQPGQTIMITSGFSFGFRIL